MWRSGGCALKGGIIYFFGAVCVFVFHLLETPVKMLQWKLTHTDKRYLFLFLFQDEHELVKENPENVQGRTERKLIIPNLREKIEHYFIIIYKDFFKQHTAAEISSGLVFLF